MSRMTVDCEKLTHKIISDLYAESLLLAETTRLYLDRDGADDRACLDPLLRTIFSYESLKITTRLMHVVAWLLVRLPSDNGAAGSTKHRGAQPPNAELPALGKASDTIMADGVERLPQRMQHMILASCDLYQRVARLSAAGETESSPNHVNQLMDRLRQSDF